MIDQEFNREFTQDESPPLKKASIIGIWKHNKIRKLVQHHRNDQNRFTAEKTFDWMDDQYIPKLDKKVK